MGLESSEFDSKKNGHASLSKEWYKEYKHMEEYMRMNEDSFCGSVSEWNLSHFTCLRFCATNTDCKVTKIIHCFRLSYGITTYYFILRQSAVC
jgi:hypothetical protein